MKIDSPNWNLIRIRGSAGTMKIHFVFFFSRRVRNRILDVSPGIRNFSLAFKCRVHSFYLFIVRLYGAWKIEQSRLANVKIIHSLSEAKAEASATKQNVNESGIVVSRSYPAESADMKKKNRNFPKKHASQANVMRNSKESFFA